MSQCVLLWLLSSLLGISLADPATYLLGDLNQYSASATSIPTFTGAVISYSGAASPDQGLTVFISSDLQQNLKQSLNSNCQAVNDQCYQSIKNILTNPTTELDPRQDPITLSIGAYIMGYISTVLAYLYNSDKNYVPLIIYLPPAQISQASAAISATEIVVGTGSDIPTITITPKPESTIVTGTASPSITTFTANVDGHSQGDVLITMPDELASRMDEIIRRSIQCPAGVTFGQKLRKRLDNYGGVICAAQAVVVNAAPGTAFADFLVVRPQGLPWASADAARAMMVVVQFAQAYAPALALDPAIAASIGISAFAVAWEVLINNKALSGSNAIPATALSGTSFAGCSSTSVNECFVDCSMIGAIKSCGTSCMPQTSCGATSLMTTTATEAMTLTADAIPTQTSVIAPPPPSPPQPGPHPPPFATGTCTVNAVQWQNSWYHGFPQIGDDTNGRTGKYSIKIDILDAAGTLIGSAPQTDAGDPASKNTVPLNVVSKLEIPLGVTPEERGDYVQFNQPGQPWQSNGKNSDPRPQCKVGSWSDGSPFKGPQRDISCTFECLWGGGKSSDGS